MKYFQTIKGLAMIDIRDIFFVCGFVMFGHGLFFYNGLWLSLTVCGPLLMLTGYLMRDKRPKGKQ
jgi:hypothetical protein